ncbi:acyl-CoA thioesterase [Arenimonas caeni]|jgi:acyl-CoA thioester hydrolase|uniref:4-hydroxybenzoyl-CoA thioesterase n=1 Tax=Arenimonas caeni TaxID=2058085 RepID=A0A2P6MB62_9GAMM|nr:thioesterase family protein [Arenimonas caeni]MDY0021700.1 thioesterase family protein [Arenimonas caeni]PRH83225.1 4-hydroxybenzoyl-CoA thioesterase [Arenimonas caeni]
MKTEFSAEVALTPAFHDLDPMDVVWHGHYLKYLELARCALLQSFDYDYPQMRDSGYAWPVVDMRTKYVRPARYGQALVVRAELLEYEHRLKIGYEVRDAATGEVLTRATSVQVAVDIATGEMCFASPEVLLRRLGKAS